MSDMAGFFPLVSLLCNLMLLCLANFSHMSVKLEPVSASAAASMTGNETSSYLVKAFILTNSLNDIQA